MSPICRFNVAGSHVNLTSNALTGLIPPHQMQSTMYTVLECFHLLKLTVNISLVRHLPASRQTLFGCLLLCELSVCLREHQTNSVYRSRSESVHVCGQHTGLCALSSTSYSFLQPKKPYRSLKSGDIIQQHQRCLSTL